MNFVRYQCPACGAPVDAASAQAAATCDYCGVYFAIASSVSQPMQRPVSPPVEPPQPPAQPGQPAQPNAPISNGRGCLWALVVWFIVGPMTAALILLPFAPFLDRTKDGAIVMPGALAVCLPVLVVAMTFFAFIHFRRSDNTLWGYVAAPARGLRRILSRGRVIFRS